MDKIIFLMHLVTVPTGENNGEINFSCKPALQSTITTTYSHRISYSYGAQAQLWKLISASKRKKKLMNSYT